MRPTITPLLLLVLTGCVGAGHESASNRPPVVKVDDAHNVSSRENHHPERYSIAPSPSIFLDATGYGFKPNSPVPEGTSVDRIEILRQKPDKERAVGERRYLVAWTPGKSQYELSSVTLQPRTGSPPFEGFKAGERWFLFVGATYETNKLFAVWSGVIEVQ